MILRTALAAIPRAWKLGAIAVLALGILGSCKIWEYRAETRGWNNHAEAVEEKNAEAVEKADTARDRVGACYDTGGVWEGRTCQR